MLYYSITGLRENKQEDKYYLRCAYDMPRATLLFYLTNICSNQRYVDINYTFSETETEQWKDSVENAVFGANFYRINCEVMGDANRSFCISGFEFPSERDMLKACDGLNRFLKIKHIHSVEKITLARVGVKFNEMRLYMEKREQNKGCLITNPNFEKEQEQIWVFPNNWLHPYDLDREISNES